MINEFIAEVKNRGMARTNRYVVNIPFPSTYGNTTVIKLASLFCESASLPGRNVNTTAARTFGETREMPYERSYEPVNFSFYVDSEMLIKNSFDTWMDMIIDPTNRTIRYYKEYAANAITIYVVSPDNQVPHVVELFEAYPKTVSSIQLSAESKDVMKLNVTMVYRYWKSTPYYIYTNSSVNGTGFPGTAQIFSNTQSGIPMQNPMGSITGVQSGQIMNLNYGNLLNRVDMAGVSGFLMSGAGGAQALGTSLLLSLIHI